MTAAITLGTLTAFDPATGSNRVALSAAELVDAALFCTGAAPAYAAGDRVLVQAGLVLGRVGR